MPRCCCGKRMSDFANRGRTAGRSERSMACGGEESGRIWEKFGAKMDISCIFPMKLIRYRYIQARSRLRTEQTHACLAVIRPERRISNEPMTENCADKTETGTARLSAGCWFGIAVGQV